MLQHGQVCDAMLQRVVGGITPKKVFKVACLRQDHNCILHVLNSSTGQRFQAPPRKRSGDAAFSAGAQKESERKCQDGGSESTSSRSPGLFATSARSLTSWVSDCILKLHQPRHLAGDVLHMRPKPDPRGLMAQEASRFNASNSEDFCIRSEQLNARSTGDCEAHASAQTNISGSAPVMGRTPDGHPQALPEHEGHPFEFACAFKHLETACCKRRCSSSLFRCS